MNAGSALPLVYRGLLVSLPFVWIGTLRLGFRWIVPDWLSFAALVVVLRRRPSALLEVFDDPPSASALGALIVWLWFAVASAVVGLAYITPSNLSFLPSSAEIVAWQGTPVQRCLLELARFVQCASAFLVTILVVRTRAQFTTALRCYVAGGMLTAGYAVYSWIGLFVGPSWPLLPGTFANVLSHRVGGTFQEPVAFGGFMLSALVAALALAETGGRRWWWAVGLFVFATLTALSTLAFIGLAVVIVTHLIQERGRNAVRLALVAVVAFAVVLAVVPARLVSQQGVEKFTRRLPSWEDRLAGWRTAAALVRAYPVSGVGPGLYVYNAARFFPEDTRDQYRGARINSPMLELTTETGLIGAALMLFMFGCLMGSVERVHRDGQAASLTRFARSVAALLLVLGAGYYTSRYAFLWIMAALAFSGARLTASANSESEAVP